MPGGSSQGERLARLRLVRFRNDGGEMTPRERFIAGMLRRRHAATEEEGAGQVIYAAGGGGLVLTCVYCVTQV